DIYIDQAMMPQILNTPDLFSVAVPFVVDTIPPGSPNYGMGFMRDDRIISVDGKEIEFVQDSREILSGRKGAEVPVRLVRNADTLEMAMKVDTLGRALIYAQVPGLMTKEYNVLSAIPAGIRLTGETIGGYLEDLKMVATPSTGAYKSVGSFIAIGQVFPGTWDWYQFLYLLGLLSIMLGVMNLLPIPGLDGGHIIFTLYEMISGKKPSDKFLIAAQMVGMVLLLMLMVLAFGNDIGRLIR
ncbi:MAG: site-2 protease family protein, partial [Bacteroidales bacterium]|nr:site-2 protease family protein [Bacteroidales bacterium]